MANAAPKIQTREQFFDSINKDFGAGTIMLLSSNSDAAIMFWTSTGVYGLDEIMSWGLPGGRIVEFFGAESSGKTTALMAAFIENARNGGINFCVDGEGTFDQDRYTQMGGDPDDVILIYVDTLEEFYAKMKRVAAWAKTQDVPGNSVVLIGVDSMPTLIPAAALALKDDDVLVAAASRVNATHLPILDKMLGSNTCLLLLNQVRDKIGSMAWSQEGNIDTPGGRIIKHAASVRVLFNKMGQLDNGKKGPDRRITGMKTGAKVVKSKIGPPLRKTEFRIMFDHRGVDNVDHCLNAFVASRVLTAPVSGVYTFKTGEKFKRDEFYLLLKARPKWTAAALKQTFELFHETIDIRRYNKAVDEAVDSD